MTAVVLRKKNEYIIRRMKTQMKCPFIKRKCKNLDLYKFCDFFSIYDVNPVIFSLGEDQSSSLGETSSKRSMIYQKVCISEVDCPQKKLLEELSQDTSIPSLCLCKLSLIPGKQDFPLPLDKIVACHSSLLCSPQQCLNL